ncbi:DUF4056 domain-containing protein [Shewanella sp. 6_MG-2023]|uniref:DUF4056 domain-containing protein n=1 Tax=Shewanella sp. 6_MG-2023 TaxID=3062660 RepID=UPI0026E24CBA|nr:DUF4056 domain-containing protein [Shewanella sp. 6_MG-2023]MDO6620573.1 DUF4056 domain-containing protein [Shewanella sp. 6_MG-2023]
MKIIKIPVAISFLGLVMTLGACSSNEWQVRALPTDIAVSAALDDIPDNALVRDITLPENAALSMPASVRPCCAFGFDQKVAMGLLPIPFYRHANTVALEDIGAHAFDAGTFSYEKGSPDSGKSMENNGMLYTRKGGFIDLAHVRDTADNAIALFYLIQPKLGQAQSIELPLEIGHRTFELAAFDVSYLSADDRWELAAAMAVRLAFTMAEAHEISQWHGYRSFALWTEAVSAYSLEDLYSNMLGAKIALAILTNNLAMTKQQYDYHMTGWLAATLAWLEPLSKEQTNALFRAIDGDWWDSNEPLPNKFVLLKRHYLLGDKQSPYLVSKEQAQASDQWDKVAAVYDAPALPQHLSLAVELFGINFDEVAVQHISVDKKFAGSFSHVPEELWLDGFTHLQFVEIAKYDEREDYKLLKQHLAENPHLTHQQTPLDDLPDTREQTEPQNAADTGAAINDAATIEPAIGALLNENN